MKAVFRRAWVLILSATLAGCAAGSSRYASDVTRFHLGGPIARGQIAVEPFQPVHANSVEFRNHAAAVERQLASLGWTVVHTVGQSEQIALVDISQGKREALAQRSPVSVGVGGGTGGWGSGVGLGVGFNLGGRPRDLIATLLEVRIKRRSDGTVFWEGRASTEAKVGSPEAQPAAAVERLAEALFRDFPGESGQTIRVE